MGETLPDRKRVEVAVLGPLEVRCDGHPVALGGPQQRAVLARLACSVGQVVSTSRLVDAIWGDHPTPGVMTTLQTHVSHLRQALEPDRGRGIPPSVLLTRGNGYLLDLPPDSVDAIRFERLVAEAQTALAERPDEALRLLDTGLALWRGEVLGDLDGFDFVEAVSTRLTDLRVTAEEARIEAFLDLGRTATALAAADRLVSAHPLREGPYGQRMVALYRAGRQAEALAAYRQMRARLDEELGVEPGPALRDLHARILAQDASLLPAERPVTEPALPALSSSVAEVTASTQGEPVAPSQRIRGMPRGVRRVNRLVGAGLGIAVVSAALLLPTSPGPAPTRLSANSLGVLDADGRVDASVEVGTGPSAVAYGDGSLWVTNQSDDTLMRVDPAGPRVTQRLDVGDSPQAVVVAGDDVWVANFGDGTVSRVSARAQRVTQIVVVGTNPAALAVVAGGLWVANSGDNTVQRIDGRTGRPGPPVGVGDGPDGLLADGSSVWVANGRDGTISHLDAATGDELSSPLQVGSGPRGMARLGPDLWVADELSQSVTRVNVSTGRSRPVYVADGPASVAVLDGSVWVANRYAGSVTSIDPTTGRVTARDVGGAPLALVASGGRLWVATGSVVGSGHRGGTLVVAAETMPGSLVVSSLPGDYVGIDPAVVYEIVTFQAERLVYEGLVATRYSPTDPQTLVPLLAVRLPRPSGGGRTFTFQLRPGLTYSSGAPVLASDFRRGLARVAAAGPAQLYRSVVGVPECIEHPTRCDLSRGVETDDAGGRVTFHLSAPDPDFLAKLSILVYPLPAGFQPGVTGPQPGTGPYAVAQYARGTAFVLRRNTHFRQSSVAASPEGYPDEVRWLKVADLRAVADAVTSGRADLGNLTPLGDRRQSADLVAELRLSHAGQVHGEPALTTDFVVLNSSVPPFDHLLARQALSYAVDRRVLADLRGGSSVAVPTCQLLPAGFPAFHAYCPYTAGRLDGTYHGPDLARAKALVAQSGTSGAAVTVVDLVGDINPPFQDYVATVLRSLGYRVTLRRLPDTAANEAYLYDEASHVQVASGGWIPDYPWPSTFYDAVVRCHPLAYPTGYCNATLDRRADAALALQSTDPGEALRQWAAIDHAVVDEAPVVFGIQVVSWWVTSTRLGNFASSPYLGGPLLSQLWVR